MNKFIMQLANDAKIMSHKEGSAAVARVRNRADDLDSSLQEGVSSKIYRDVANKMYEMLDVEG